MRAIKGATWVTLIVKPLLQNYGMTCAQSFMTRHMQAMSTADIKKALERTMALDNPMQLIHDEGCCSPHRYIAL